MAFFTYRDISLTLNGQPFFANSLTLSQDAEINGYFEEGESTHARNSASSPMVNSLKINYYLTGKDYLRDFIYTDHRENLTGLIGGLRFNNGYLESYSLSAEPNSPINISASIKICDEISGALASSAPQYYPSNFQVCNFNDAQFNAFASYSSPTLNNITRFSWNYSADVTPVYHYKQTGESFINADRVVVGEKNITCDIVSDNSQIPLRFTGENYALELQCYNPSRTVSETYGISGKISKKQFNISTDSLSESVYTISQNHISERPRISALNTSTYPTNNYITISSELYPENFSTKNNGFPVVSKVILGDRDLKFTTSINVGSNDVILATIPSDAINGYLRIETTKGLINYPTPITLNFPAIGVSGFTPITGAEHNTIQISGTNFQRISDVRFNNLSTSYQVVDNTGTFHKINAYVPRNATIGRISVHSFLRNLSGFSTGSFYPAMDIISFTPTGTWSGVCIISGRNFTGVSNVYFNGVRSPNFTVNNNTQITARTPITGAGFPKGYLTISGVQGMSVRSKTTYQPILKITGVSLISGRPDNDIALSGLFDSGYLYFESGGYRVAFGNEYSIFLRSGNPGGARSNFILTGYAPISSFGRAKPAMVEPDGATKYTPFNSDFIQVSKPIVTSLNGEQDSYTTTIFQRHAFWSLKGQNFDYFFGTPYSVIISGNGMSWDGTNWNIERRDALSTYTDVTASDDGLSLIVRNVRMTGSLLQHIWGKIGVVNFAGTGWWPGSLTFTNVGPNGDYSMMLKTPSSSSFQILGTLWNQWNQWVQYPAALALDSDTITTAFSARFGTTYLDGVSDPNDANYNQILRTSGFMKFNFATPVDFGGIRVQQSSYIPADDTQPFGLTENNYKYLPVPGQTYSLATTGMLECYGDAGRLFSTGITFINNNYSFSNAQMATGVKEIRLFRNDGQNRFLAISYLQFFG